MIVRDPIKDIDRKTSFLVDSMDDASESVADKLRMISDHEGVSSIVLFLTAFAILIYRYTRGESALEVGIALTSRNNWKKQSISEIKTHPVQIPLQNDLNFSQAIQRVSSVIPDSLGSPCLLSSNGEPITLTLSWHEPDHQSSLKVSIYYEKDLITEFSSQKILGLSESEIQIESHWQTLIDAIIQNPEANIQELPILGDEERELILSQWSQSESVPDLVQTVPLHHHFEAQVSRHPEQTALICRDKQMSYAELDRRANQLAYELHSRGIGRGSFVGIFLPRSMDVYISILGILKSGAAYVPIDPSYPSDRVAYILDDCDASALITTSEMSEKLTGIHRAMIKLDLEKERLSQHPSERILTKILPNDPAYVIYTSGTTGRPKGVLIEHRNVSSFVNSEAHLFKVRPEDRVYQGFSVAFDASIEEIWLAFFAGATLVVGTDEMVHAGPALAGMLAEAGVTVLSCVPTLLSMMDEDVPSIRLLILGGEQCPQDLVMRWWKKGRRLVNSYGPTEATVVATCTDCHPDEFITIGKAIPNYYTYILDEQHQPVPIGVPGELHLGGVGVARGYINRPDLTQNKFIQNPFTQDAVHAPRLYKTGDLVRYMPDGKIEFLGRIDGQVKLRGFRIELAEIESLLMQCSSIQSAVVSVREDIPGIQQLTAYIIPRADEAFDELKAKSALKDRLPAYMVPAAFVIVDEFPTLPSGKVDRKRLPAPKLTTDSAEKPNREARTEIEQKILKVWEKLFQPQSVSVTDNFFDLGGHSLLAARMVSELRADPQMQNLAMLDVYHHPVLEDFAKFAEENATEKQPVEPDQPESKQKTSCSQRKFRFCTLGQLFGIYPIAGLIGMPWLALYFAFEYMLKGHHTLVQDSIIFLSVFYSLFPALMLISVAAKWILIGRYKEGVYPLWGFYYWRFWLVQRIRGLVPITYFKGTPFLNSYMKLLGADIGSNVYLGTPHLGITDLIKIDEDSSIGLDAQLPGYRVEDGKLIIGRIEIGKRCYVGARSVVSQDTIMQDDSRLDEQSMLPEGSVLPRLEEWSGSPARYKASVSEAEQKIQIPANKIADAWYELVYSVSLFFVFPLVPVLAMTPGSLFLLYLIDRYGILLSLCSAPLLSVTFISILCLEIASVKWILLGHVKPGQYQLKSGFYVKKWFVDSLLQMGLELLHPVYATLYLPPWFRLLGAKLGRRVEISTAGHLSPDLLTLGAESFIADSACLGAMKVHLGILTIEQTTIGKRTFIGNSALIPPSTVIGDGYLIGVLSTPPSNEVLAENSGSSWLGSPSVLLPRRQESASFSDQVTFNPPWYLYLVRGFIEFFRITLPSSLFTLLSVLLVVSTAYLGKHVSSLDLILLFPSLYLILAVTTALFVVVLKWAVMGQYKPGNHPLWSSFVWRTEMVTGVYESYSVPFLLNMLQGTPFINWYLRLMGSRIGKRVFMETTQITEFDLAHIGDDVALNHSCTIQTHLFEDRVMKTSVVEVGKECTVGPMAVVLYDSEMQERSILSSLSLLMKGETLPAHTRWEGVPAIREIKPVTERAVHSEIPTHAAIEGMEYARAAKAVTRA